MNPPTAASATPLASVVPAIKPAGPAFSGPELVMFVEATSIPGRGKLILTGQLGDVMKESAQAALTLVKSRARVDSPSRRANSVSETP